MAITINFILTHHNRKTDKNSDEICIAQSPLILVLGIVCILCAMAIIIILFVEESEIQMSVIILAILFAVIGGIVLLSCRKKLQIRDKKLIYRPMIGIKRAINISNISYIKCDRESAIIFTNEERSFCCLNYLMTNYETMITFCKNEGIEVRMER